jgi:hypothetical protein
MYTAASPGNLSPIPAGGGTIALGFEAPVDNRRRRQGGKNLELDAGRAESSGRHNRKECPDYANRRALHLNRPPVIDSGRPIVRTDITIGITAN